jgi:hypothetical protein
MGVCVMSIRVGSSHGIRTTSERGSRPEAFLARFPDYDKGITLPAIVDVPTGQVVTNDFAQITIDLSLREGVPPAVRAAG